MTGRYWPKPWHVATDEYTAYFYVDKDEDREVRDLLERAGVYRRRWDLDRKCWAIPLGELAGVVEYAAAYNGRTIYASEDPWVVSA